MVFNCLTLLETANVPWLERRPAARRVPAGLRAAAGAELHVQEPPVRGCQRGASKGGVRADLQVDTHQASELDSTKARVLRRGL